MIEGSTLCVLQIQFLLLTTSLPHMVTCEAMYMYLKRGGSPCLKYTPVLGLWKATSEHVNFLGEHTSMPP